MNVPVPKLFVSPRTLHLGEINASDSPQWHTVRLVNAGGGASEKWTPSRRDDALPFNLRSGNLRTGQEIFCQVKNVSLKPGGYKRTIRVQGEGGAADILQVKFRLSDESQEMS